MPNRLYPKDEWPCVTPVAYNRRDMLIYATSLGLGAGDGFFEAKSSSAENDRQKEVELKYVYELSPQFSMFPTYPVPWIFWAPDENGPPPVMDQIKGELEKQFPDIPARKSRGQDVHYEQSITLLRPFPHSGSFLVKARAMNAYQASKGVIMEFEQEIVDRVSGEVFAKMEGSSFRLQCEAKMLPVRPKHPLYDAEVPNRAPDFADRYRTWKNQHSLYGQVCPPDANVIHIIDAEAVKFGYKRLILHGTLNFSLGAKAIVRHCCLNDPSRLVSFGCRFSKPIYPENICVTSIWKIGEDAEGNERYVFRMVCEDEKVGGKEHVALQGGWAVVRKA